MLVNEELNNKVVDVRRVIGRVMSHAIVFEEEVRVVCAYAPKSGKSIEETEFFFMTTYQEN